PVSGIEDINVPNGFNFQTEKAVQFNLTTVDSLGAASGPIKLKIFGVKDGGTTDEIFSGASNAEGNFSMTLNLSIHFEKVVIATDHDGSIFQNEYAVSDVITAVLTYNGNLQSGAAETRSNNCYPSVTAAFTPNNKGVSLNSDKKMTSIKIYYKDGTSETVQVDAKSFSF
ncbi:MAG: hypothetical protein AAF573_14415, partial [Bacteroidota bacterium]